jgi:hypothetical protein
VSRFEIDPLQPYCIKRNILELLLAPDGLVTVAHQDDNSYLHKVHDRIEAGKVQRRESSCIGALAAMIIEDQLVHNERILDQLEAEIDRFAEIAETGPLLYHDTHDSLPTLGKTLAYFRRKIKQNEEVINAIRLAAEENPHFFLGKSASSYLVGLNSRLNNLIVHADDTITKLKDVQGQNDRQSKGRGDKNIENYTILIGISAPPIMADIFCKVLLKHFEPYHAAIVGASFIVGIGLVLFDMIPKWVHDFKLRRAESVR